MRYGTPYRKRLEDRSFVNLDINLATWSPTAIPARVCQRVSHVTLFGPNRHLQDSESYLPLAMAFGEDIVHTTHNGRPMPMGTTQSTEVTS